LRSAAINYGAVSPRANAPPAATKTAARGSECPAQARAGERGIGKRKEK